MLKKILKHCKLDLRLTVSDAASLLNAKHWESVNNNNNIYLSLPYLKAMEESSDDMRFRYVIAYDEASNPVLIGYFQLVTIKNIDHNIKGYLSQFISPKTLDKLVPSVQMNLLLCGNLFVCGEHGYAYDPKLSDKGAMEWLAEAMHRVSSELEGSEKNSIMIIKDIFPENDPNMEAFSDERFYPFEIDSNMVLRISQQWQSMEDYYQCMTSKFRTKAKAIRKKSEGLNAQFWEAEDIEKHSELIDSLHRAVLENSEFSLGEMTAKNFAAIKAALGERMRFRAYEYSGAIVGFSIAILGSDYLDAVHVGLNYELNKKMALYQRMLHDFVELAIEEQRDELRFGRTAEQIKSTLGAEPLSMRLYLRHRNHIVNHLLKPLVEDIRPSGFQQRFPFKAAYSVV